MPVAPSWGFIHSLLCISASRKKGKPVETAVAIEVEPSSTSVQNGQANELTNGSKKDKKPKSRAKKALLVETDTPGTLLKSPCRAISLIVIRSGNSLRSFNSG